MHQAWVDYMAEKEASLLQHILQNGCRLGLRRGLVDYSPHELQLPLAFHLVIHTIVIIFFWESQIWANNQFNEEIIKQ